MLTAPERIFQLPIAQPFIRAAGMTSASQLLLPLTIIFGVAAIFSGSIRLFLLWASTRLSYATGADLSISIYRRTLYQPYFIHVSRNSSEIISGITNKTGVVIASLTNVLNFLSSTIILLAILVTLVSIDPIIALAAFGGFGLLYGLIIQVTRKNLLANSQRISLESTKVIKSLQE
ncbi:MAG: ABC transporter ATP-binding protein, partial [Pelodictyon phaeoclathratiforme]